MRYLGGNDISRAKLCKIFLRTAFLGGTAGEQRAGSSVRTREKALHAKADRFSDAGNHGNILAASLPLIHHLITRDNALHFPKRHRQRKIRIAQNRRRLQNGAALHCALKHSPCIIPPRCVGGQPFGEKILFGHLVCSSVFFVATLYYMVKALRLCAPPLRERKRCGQTVAFFEELW